MDTQWFKNAKFGLFIHWGLYSVAGGEWNGVQTPGTAEWIMYHGKIPKEEYRLLAKEFNPTDFDAKKIVELAKSLSMKYIVITAKHHDGFAMYNSKASDYNIVKSTPYGKDPLKELSKECAKAGIKFCIYYSHGQDWDDENGFTKGHTDNLEQRQKNFDIYLENKCLPQLTELLTNYGEVSLIWFDGPLYITREQSEKVKQTVRKYMPNCLTNTRIGNGFEDYFTTGDNMIPAIPIQSMWEAPGTTNNSWGYSKFDNNWKNPKTLIKNLIKITSRGGNYLMNVGPDSKGNIPHGSLKVLKTISDWLKINKDSIENTVTMPIFPYEVEGVLFTTKLNKLFVHITEYSELIHFIGVHNNVKNAYFLSNGEELEWEQRINNIESIRHIVLNIPEKYKDDLIPVVCLELEEEELEVGLNIN